MTKEKMQQENRNIVGVTVWFCLTTIYAMCFYFYRVNILVGCMFAVAYLLISSWIATKIRSTVENVQERKSRTQIYQKRLIVCSMIILVLISVSSSIAQMQEALLQEQYLEEMEERPSVLELRTP